MDGLDTFLNGGEAAPTPAPAAEASPAPAEAQPAAPAAEAPAGQPRGERGRFAPKGDTAPAEEPKAEPGAPPAPKTDEPPLDHPALIAERRRRQDAERRLEELSRPATPAPTPTAAQPGPAAPAGPPDRFEDPDGYDQWLIATVTQRARAEAIAAHQEERIATSADVARAKYPDWAEKATVFAELARANPALEHALRNNPNPGEYAYSTAKLHLELQQHGSLDALIAAREEAARAAAREEATRAGTIAPPANPAIPESLAGSQSSRAAAPAAPQGPLSLDDILKRQK